MVKIGRGKEGKGMTFKLEFDTSPLYELNFSFGIFKRPLGMRFLKTLDIGVEWNPTVKSMVGDEFVKKVENAGELSFLNFIDVLIYESQRKQHVNDFLQWLEQLSIGGIYEVLAPYLTHHSGLPILLDEERKKCVELLYEWNEKYFSTLSQLPGQIKADVSKSEELFKFESTEDLLLKLTEGITIEPTTGLDTVILTPTTHYRPLSAVYINKKINIVRYPLYFGEDLLKLERTRITNIGRAISDESRLEMLKILSTQKYNLTELAQRLGTTKANAHHHLVFLRIAGLLKVHVIEGKSLYYSLNSNFTENLKEKLDSLFLY